MMRSAALVLTLFCFNITAHARDANDRSYINAVARDSLGDLEVMNFSVVCGYSNQNVNVAADYLNEILRAIRAQRKFTVSAPALHDDHICVTVTLSN